MPSDHHTRHLNCPASFIDTLSGVFGRPLWSGNSIHWTSAAGPVRAAVRALDAVTVDGRKLQGAISVVQELHLASPELARHNQEPGLGAAFVVDGSPDIVEVVSRVTWYRDEEDIRNKLGVTLAIAALTNMTASLDYGAGHPLPRLPQHDQPSRWSEQDLMSLARQMHRLGGRVWVAGPNLVARLSCSEALFPGTEDTGDPTVVMSTQCVHPSLGRGLAMEASLCLGLPEQQASTLASRLNRMEAGSITGPPLLGAWALNLSGQRLSFRSFWPNLAYIPGFLDHIATWQLQRLELAKDALTHVGKRCVA